MELSGLEVLALVKEINGALDRSYVNNVYSLGDSQVLRLRSPPHEDVWLVASPKFGVWVSKRVNERAETTTFTSALRRDLDRARFTGATQVGLDRVFILDFEARGGSRSMIVEMMPPGNIIVTDKGGTILLIKKEVRARSRRLVRGGRYAPPSANRADPGQATEAVIIDALNKESTAGKAIGRHMALPRKYVGEILARLQVSESTPSTALAGREAEVADALRALVDSARHGASPCLCKTPDGRDLFVVKPTGLEVIETAASVSEVCDSELLGPASESLNSDDPSQTRRREMEQSLARLKAQQAGLGEEAARMRVLARKASGLTSVSEAVAVVTSEAGISGRAPRSTAAAASILFERAKQLESDSKKVDEVIRKLTADYSKLPASKGPKKSPLARKKQEWFEKFRWFTTSDGRLAIGGRDAQSNSVLVKRHLEPGDTIYHADLFGSPFFVLKDGKNQTEADVTEVAQATASFSSAWKTGLAAADVYWVAPDQVSASAPSGEYLAKGSFAIRGKKNYIAHSLVEVTIGVDRDGRVLAGPESALGKTSQGYVVLRPAREKGSDTAKKVRSELSLMLPELSQGPSLDDVMRALPSGGGKVVRTKKVKDD